MKINFLNFFLPKEKIDKEKIKNILKNRIIYFPKKEMIIFFPYRNIYIKKSIWKVKFKRNFTLAKFFGEIIYENLPEILQDLKIQKNFNNPLLLNIPISFFKKISRGYNQNDIIIQEFFNLGGNNFIEWNKNNLKKKKHTKPQSSIKNKYERIDNIKNSFKLKNPEHIKGRNVFLFDDILTTGATLNEAKKILKKAGANKIICIVLAH